MSFIRKLLGSRGERLAARHLKRSGCRILARNFTVRQGEIDLVAHERKTGCIIFVEVKTRRDESSVRAEQAVGKDKQRHIVRAAQAFLKSRAIPPNTPLRFDVVAVVFGDRRRPQLRHTIDAFRMPH